MNKNVYMGSCKIVSCDEMKEPTLEFKVKEPMDDHSKLLSTLKKKVNEVMADETRCYIGHIEITISKFVETEDCKLYPDDSYTKYYYEW